jgi:hypothetical protein
MILFKIKKRQTVHKLSASLKQVLNKLVLRYYYPVVNADVVNQAGEVRSG